MNIADEIMVALRSAKEQSEPLVDPKASRVWQTSLQKALAGPVEEVTRYPMARAYRFDRVVAGDQNERWRTELRIRISGVGPYASHMFVELSNLDHWWAGAVRTNRAGFYPEHQDVLARLRAWYHEHGITEVDHHVLALPAPEGVVRRKREGAAPTVFDALFGE